MRLGNRRATVSDRAAVNALTPDETVAACFRKRAPDPIMCAMSIMVHLVRHAQTTWNVEGRFLGAADIPLTPLGHAHARQLVTAFADVPLVAVYASDLCRARDTAAPVAAAHELPVQPDVRLREMNQGELEGYRGAELHARPEYDAFFAEWARESVDAVAPGGESLRQTLARASAALGAIVEAHHCDDNDGGETHVLVVSHGLTLQMLIADAIGLPLENAGRIRPQHGSVSTVRYPAPDEPRARYPVLLRLNDRHHLRDEP